MRNTSGKFELCWDTTMRNDAIGNAYGYRVHNNTLRKYVSKIANLTEDASDAFMILAPEFYRVRVPNKVNWLFTMFEGEDLPKAWIKNIQKADYLIMPSTWCKTVFSQYFDPDKIFVVNHGIEPDFTYKKRSLSGAKPFRFLWVGAPNPRKGWEEIIAIWDKAGFSKIEGVELYIKTTRYDKLERRGNVILDGRNLKRSQLVRLYHQAHCFLFPTRGEGFGLTLAEAMRTGLPCIATNYSGVTDFFDENVGYPVDYKLGEQEVKNAFTGEVVDTVTAAFPEVEHIVERMVEVLSDYKAAMKKGERASARIRSKFTWPAAARNLVRVMRERSC